MNESDDYSAQLYDLYSKGKEACNIFQVEIRRLADRISPEKSMLSWPGENRRAFEDTFKRLNQLSGDWYGAAMDIINQIPSISFRARFSADVKTTDGELRALYSQYHQTGCIKACYGVLRVNNIIVHKCNIESERRSSVRRRLRRFATDTSYWSDAGIYYTKTDLMGVLLWMIMTKNQNCHSGDA